MLPVSGAEQLNTSGAHGTRPIDSARCVFEVRQPCAMRRLGKEQIPQPGACLRLQLFDEFGRSPARAALRVFFDLIKPFVRINVLLHKRIDALAQLLDFRRIVELHIAQNSSAQSTRRLAI